MLLAAHRSAKPLWGFGWAGGLLLAIALSLAALMITGVDVRFWFFERLTRSAGYKPVYELTAWVIPSLLYFDFPFLPVTNSWSWSPPAMRFSVTTLCVMLVALQVHPRRVGVVRVVVLSFACLCATAATLRWIALIGSLLNGGVPRFSSGSPAGVSALSLHCAAYAALISVITMWVCRSWLIGAAVAAFSALGAWVAVESARSSAATFMSPLLMRISGSEPWVVWSSWLWNPLLFVILLGWAIRARLRVCPAYGCQSCGYDLRGSPTGPCPECGAARPNLEMPDAQPEPLSTS